MAGLDQLRARLRALEQIGEPAEARALLEKLGRAARRAAGGAGGAARRRSRRGIGALERPDGAAALAERLARLHEQKDAGLEAALGRLGPLEAKLAALEGEPRAGARGAEARLDAARLEARLEAGRRGLERRAARRGRARGAAPRSWRGSRAQQARALARAG